MCPCRTLGNHALIEKPCRPLPCRTCKWLLLLFASYLPLLLLSSSGSSALFSCSSLLGLELCSLFISEQLFSFFFWKRSQKPIARKLLLGFLGVVVDIKGSMYIRLASLAL